MRNRALLLLWGVGATLWILVWAAEGSQEQAVLIAETTAPTGSSELSDRITASAGSPGKPDPASSSERKACIDVNTADGAELTEIPGIGPVIAERICAYRTSHGRFKGIPDLDKVKGIGPSKLEKIREHVCF